MKTITFAIQKGGTGKTSTAVSVAVELANAGKRVLVIDADPQGNATTWMNLRKYDFELADVLLKKCEPADSIVPTVVENLDFIPTDAVNGNLKIYSKTSANGSPFAIRHLLKPYSTVYDFCVIDTSPKFEALEESCLLASDEAVTVLKLDEFSKEGLISFLSNIENMKERYDTEKPKINKLVLNGRDLRLPLQEKVLEELKSKSNKSNLYIIPVDQSFSKAQAVHYPIQGLQGVKTETLNVITQLAFDLSKVEE